MNAANALDKLPKTILKPNPYFEEVVIMNPHMYRDLREALQEYNLKKRQQHGGTNQTGGRSVGVDVSNAAKIPARLSPQEEAAKTKMIHENILKWELKTGEHGVADKFLQLEKLRYMLYLHAATKKKLPANYTVSQLVFTIRKLSEQVKSKMSVLHKMMTDAAKTVASWRKEGFDENEKPIFASSSFVSNGGDSKPKWDAAHLALLQEEEKQQQTTAASDELSKLTNIYDSEEKTGFQQPPPVASRKPTFQDVVLPPYEDIIYQQTGRGAKTGRKRKRKNPPTQPKRNLNRKRKKSLASGNARKRWTMVH